MPDDKRPLNKRGKRDAPFMAQKLLEQLPSVNLLISSHAKRAHTTAIEFANAYQLSRKDITIDSTLYHASVDAILSVVFGIENEVDTVLLFGHNPGFTYFVNQVSEIDIDNVPTTGIVGLEVDVESWEDFYFDKARFIHFLYPKKYFAI